jgi:hypothetical protein
MESFSHAQRRPRVASNSLPIRRQLFAQFGSKLGETARERFGILTGFEECPQPGFFFRETRRTAFLKFRDQKILALERGVKEQGKQYLQFMQL